MTAKKNKAFSQELLNYAILIQNNNSSIGSGTFVQIGMSVYLITAKHVLYDLRPKSPTLGKLKFPQIRIGFYPREKELSSYQTIDIITSQLESDQLIHKIETDDICGIRIFKDIGSKPKLAEGIVAKNKFTLNPIPQKIFKQFGEIEIGTDVYLMGYPSSIGIKQNQQFPSDKPLLRKGIIAGKNDSTQTLIADCQVHHGNSGCPVFVTEQSISSANNSFKINNEIYFIGIAIQYIPYASKSKAGTQWLNSGYSVVQPIDALLETLRKYEDESAA